MDRESSNLEGLHDGDDNPKPQDDQDVCQDQGSGQQEVPEEIKQDEAKNLLNVLGNTVDHFFPKFNEWLESLTDRRDKDLITYELKTVVWAALIVFITNRKSRLKITHEMRTPQVLKNLKEFSDQSDMENVPHGDTVEYSFLRMKEAELEDITARMMKSLLRNRVLESYRLLNKYHTIAIDGCHTHTFHYKHCEHCLFKKDDKGNRLWMHYKLQASLVTPSGMCLPMASEWIENDRRRFDKQDCEIRACKRLLEKIRRLYPRLPICVILDALYANQPMFRQLAKHQMEWIVVFKEGNNPESYTWAMNMKKNVQKENTLIQEDTRDIDARYTRTHEERLLREKPRRLRRQVHKKAIYTWRNNIEHWDDQRIFNVLTCKEVEDNKTNCDYVWLVSDGLNLSRDNAKELAQRGRLRWTIENQGTNTLKNGGYHLEHLYSRDPVSMKIWHRILDMAFLINQLIEKGSLIVKKDFGSTANIAARMFEHFRYCTFKKPAQRPRIQIRLQWDTS